MKAHCNEVRSRRKSDTSLVFLLLVLVISWVISCSRSTQPQYEDGRVFLRLGYSPQSWPYSTNGYLKLTTSAEGWEDVVEKYIFALQYEEVAQLMEELNLPDADALDWRVIQGRLTDITGRLIEGGKGVMTTLTEFAPGTESAPGVSRFRSTSFTVNGNVILEIYPINLETKYCPWAIRVP